jgi:hypothetical protein
LNQLPYAAAFHDYSLRHPTTNERVDNAISDTFGAPIPLVKIGRQFANGGAHPNKATPSADGHYWDTPGSEGGLLVLPSTLGAA